MTENTLNHGTKISATLNKKEKVLLLDYSQQIVTYREIPEDNETIVYTAFPVRLEYKGNYKSEALFNSVWISKELKNPLVIEDTLFGIDLTLEQLGFKYYTPLDVEVMPMIRGLFVKEDLLTLEPED